MLIDAHAHVDRYDEELSAALEEINRVRIFTVSTAMDVPSYERNREIAARCPLVLPAFGIHPWNAPQYAGRLEELAAYIDASPMLGEIGLDHRWVEDASAYPAQRRVLEFFLAAARDQDKIVNLHTSGAEREVMELLERFAVRRAIVHWYAGPLDLLREWIGRGAYFTIGVEIFSSEHIQNIAREIPMDRLLTETDNPGGLKWLNGTLGMPSHLQQVVERLAIVRGIRANQVTSAVEANWRRLIENDPIQIP